MGSRRAFGLVEVMVAVAVMSLVVIALITSGGALHRRSHATESHTLATLRARVLLDLVRALDFEVLDRRAGGGSVAVPLEELYEPGARVVLFGPLAVDPGTRRYLDRIRSFTDEVRWTRVAPDLARIDVVVGWTEPLATAPAPRHEIKLAALVERPETGFAAAGAR